MKKHNKITAQERDQIAIDLAAGLSLRKIAAKLGRSVSSISDEIKRNSSGSKYQAIKAQELSGKRNRVSRSINPLKNNKVYSYVYDKLRRGWSPEEIACKLRRNNGGKTIICHETIYRYIYSKEGKAHRKGIHTFLERKTRYYQAKLLENIDSEFGVRSQLKVFGSLPPRARLSATFDNGKENYNHTKLRTKLKMKTYFCDPNAAWQKGANEHFNGVLRRYIPKKTDLTTVSQLELDSIVEEINNRPLKCLNYQTPNEAFNHELQSITNYSKWSDSK